jgi:gelsolin
MELTQLPLSKSSLNSGDAFILFAGPKKVWIWNGETARPNEKFLANTEGEKLCTQGTVQVMTQGDGDEAEEFADFWQYLGDGEIQPATSDHTVTEFVPVLYQITNEPGAEPVEVAKATAPVKKGAGGSKLSRSLLDESNVYLLDSSWTVYVWIGEAADKSEKLMAFLKGDAYCKKDDRTASASLEIVKSGKESASFESYFE